jgi:hypothetical protein
MDTSREAKLSSWKLAHGYAKVAVYPGCGHKRKSSCPDLDFLGPLLMLDICNRTGVLLSVALKQ